MRTSLFQNYWIQNPVKTKSRTLYNIRFYQIPLNESQGQSQLERSGKFAIIYTKMNGQFEGQSYVKDFVSTYEEAEKKIASYEDGLSILSDEDYFRLVKKRGNLEFYSII